MKKLKSLPTLIGLLLPLLSANSFATCDSCWDYEHVISQLEETETLLNLKKVDTNTLDQNVDLINKYCAEIYSGATHNSSYEGNVMWCQANCWGKRIRIKDPDTGQGYDEKDAGHKYCKKVRKACKKIIKKYLNGPTIIQNIEYDKSSNKLAMKWHEIHMTVK